MPKLKLPNTQALLINIALGVVGYVVLMAFATGQMGVLEVHRLSIRGDADAAGFSLFSLMTFYAAPIWAAYKSSRLLRCACLIAAGLVFLVYTAVAYWSWMVLFPLGAYFLMALFLLLSWLDKPTTDI